MNLENHADSMISKPISKLLSALHLEANITHSVGSLSPRKGRQSTWVKVDCLVPPMFSNYATVDNLVEQWFESKDGVDSYIWAHVAMIITGGEAKYVARKADTDKNEKEMGFIYISKFRVDFLLRNAGSSENSIGFAMNLFNTELRDYSTWQNSNIFDITIFSKHVNIKDEKMFTYNTDDNIEKMIVHASENVIKRIDAIHDANKLIVTVDKNYCSDNPSDAIMFFTDQLYNMFGARLCMGSHEVKEQQSSNTYQLQITYLAKSLPFFNEMEAHCEGDLFSLLKGNILELNNTGRFKTYDAWDVARFMLHDDYCDHWPPIMFKALMMTIISQLEGVEFIAHTANPSHLSHG